MSEADDWLTDATKLWTSESRAEEGFVPKELRIWTTQCGNDSRSAEGIFREALLHLDIIEQLFGGHPYDSPPAGLKSLRLDMGANQRGATEEMLGKYIILACNQSLRISAKLLEVGCGGTDRWFWQAGNNETLCWNGGVPIVALFGTMFTEHAMFLAKANFTDDEALMVRRIAH